jgi:internalin A
LFFFQNGLGLGERISQFMSRLATGDRVFIILNAKYLQSPYCMAELFEVWRNCRGAAAEFLQHIRVFRLPDAAMMSPLERAQCAVHWKQQFDALNALVKEHGADILGESDFQRYKLMQDFAHRVGDILALIADTLLPKDFDELTQHGFAE